MAPFDPSTRFNGIKWMKHVSFSPVVWCSRYDHQRVKQRLSHRPAQKRSGHGRIGNRPPAGDLIFPHFPLTAMHWWFIVSSYSHTGLQPVFGLLKKNFLKNSFNVDPFSNWLSFIFVQLPVTSCSWHLKCSRHAAQHSGCQLDCLISQLIERIFFWRPIWKRGEIVVIFSAFLLSSMNFYSFE